MSVTAKGIEVTGEVTASGGITGSFVGDGSGLTGVTAAVDIDTLDALTSPHQTEDHFIISDDGTEKKITFSNVQDAVFADVSGDVAIAAGGAATIQADSVENSMLANIARGSVKVGGASDAPTDLDAKTSGQILVGDGTDINSVAVSGDVSLASNGAVTIAANAVEGSMLNSNVAGTGIDYTGLSATLDISSAQTGIETIYNTSLIIGRAANDTTINFTTDDEIIFDQGSTEAMKIDSTGVTVAGNLTVNGSTTTISSTNLNVADAFIFAASGSAGSNVDGGLIVQEGSNEGTGSALYHDTSDNRWAVAKTVKAADTAVTALEHVVTVKQLGDNDAAIEGDKEYGAGEMAINNDGTIWIYS